MDAMPNLKVIHVASGDLWGGAEAQVHTQCKYLQRYSHILLEVVVLNDGQLKRRLDEEGIVTHLVDEQCLGVYALIKELCVIFQKSRPHIVHTHGPKQNILAPLANLFTARAKCVRTQHGAPEFSYSWSQPDQLFQFWVDQFCGRYLQKKIISVSKELAEKLTKQYSSDHIEIIQNGVDLEALGKGFEKAWFKVEKPEVFHIGIIGRLVQVKRIDLFIDMAKSMLEQSANSNLYHFHIIGDGPLKIDLERKVKQLGMCKKLDFHGHIDQVSSYLTSLDVLVMCSDHEGLPMTLLEATALGVPVVGHNVGAMKEPFSSKKGGVLSKQHDAMSYADAVIGLLKHEQSELIEGGQRWLQQNCTAEDNAKRLMILYEKLLT
tara:strand:- start:13076 stop:14206 length:1131 start_codon:yes stop_codon:yes gene_type:complete